MDKIHQDVYKYRYVDGLSLRETGIKLDVSTEWVRQIEMDLLRKIQNKMSMLND
jgi:DNA-directed RNA polymerase specialized sigma subunit